MSPNIWREDSCLYYRSDILKQIGLLSFDLRLLDYPQLFRYEGNFQLSQVDGFADLTAQYLKDGIEGLYQQMEDLLNTNKINIRGVKETGKLDGKSFCITGSLENFKPRSEAEELVIKLGGIVKKNVTKDLDYLVTNSDEPTKKYTTAQGQENTKIISEEQFLKLVE